MKKIFIILTAFTLSQDYPILGSDTSLDILTWNIEHYPKHNQTNTYLEDIITQINVDIIALQEIESTNSLNNLIYLLEGNWEGYRSADTQYGEISYLINTDEIEIISLLIISICWIIFLRASEFFKLSYAYPIVNNYILENYFLFKEINSWNIYKFKKDM